MYVDCGECCLGWAKEAAVVLKHLQLSISSILLRHLIVETETTCSVFGLLVK